MSQERSRRNVLAGAVKVDDVRGLAVFQKREPLYGSLATLAMGDSQAVSLAQTCHVGMCLKSELVEANQLLTLSGPLPRADNKVGIIIDDFVVLSTVKDGETEPSRGANLSGKVEELYKEVGLIPHPEKAFRDEERSTFWGADFDGKRGLIRGSLKRAIPLAWILLRVAELGVCSVELLQTLSGSLVSLMLFRRRMLSLLDMFFAATRGRNGNDVVQLSKRLVSEMLVCATLLPLAVTNLRAEVSGRITATDASDWGEAAEIPNVLAEELYRHTLRKSVWTRLLAPADAWMRSHSLLPAAAELPDPSQTFSANPLWSVLARCLDCVLLYKTQAKGRRHINIGALRGFLKAEKKLGLEKASARQLFGLDSQVCLGCICKGRSASESLNQELCRSLPTILFCDSYSECMYYQSAENPADDPTRGVCLRKKTMETPDWFLASCTGDFSGLDSWLEAQGICDYQLTGLPPVSELTQRVFKSFPSAEISSGSEMGHTAQNNDVQPVSEVQTGFEKGSNAPNGGVYNKPACLSSSAFQLRTDCATEVSNRAPGQLAFCSGAGLGEDWRFTGRRGVLSSANSKLVQHLLRQFKKEQVVFGADETWPPCTAGFLDLFSGEKGVAKEFARETGCWVLTFDIEHDASEDLSNKVLQR